MARIKVGLIGCGKITQVSHAPAFAAMPGKVTVTGITDLNLKAAKALNKDHGLNATIYKTVDELLASGIDAVVISTPNTFHAPLTIQALKSGIHVLVEKPMAVSFTEADAMIREAKKRKKILQVNQSFRYDPPHVKVKELIDAGTIGDIIHMRCIRAGANSPDKGWSPGAKWFVQSKFRGGLIMDIAVHLADYMGWCCGKAKTVYALNKTRIKGNDVPDNVTTLFDFESGATGVLELSWTLPVGAGSTEIYGTKGSIFMGDDKPGIQLVLTGKKAKIVKAKKVPTSHQCFVDAINGKASTPVPGEVGRHALAYCLAIEDSGKSGKAVKVKLK
ncbi:MAG: Gfo/Idh/MocA family oxidoreductase [Lentisphaeria bacterium]|nr:Gfo/Idh/MocA family oxidoreductase [Lentisphaeria bacterium]NQZ70549.1 Gfo/Idh/MocA family oxidoreductase [Lentisphaeria bacterium]